MKVPRIILFVLILFFALPELAIGVPALVNGIRARGEVWSVQHNYFGDAAFALIPALCAIVLAYAGPSARRPRTGCTSPLPPASSS